MSWSLFLSDLQAEDFLKTVDETVPQGGDGTAETNNQIGVARQIAVQIFGSGQLGNPTPESRYSCSLSGHANPGHELVQGGANEAINVTVARYLPLASSVYQAMASVHLRPEPEITEPVTDSAVQGEVELAARSHVEVASAAVVQAEPVHLQIAGTAAAESEPEPAPVVEEAPELTLEVEE